MTESSRKGERVLHLSGPELLPGLGGEVVLWELAFEQEDGAHTYSVLGERHALGHMLYMFYICIC